MFDPSPEELAKAGDLFQDLLKQGRKLMRTPEAQSERLREQQDESAARSALAAQRAMERFLWRPRASVALINRCTCATCGAESNLFAGFGVLMYRNTDAAERLVMTPILDPAWPKETHYTHTIHSSCMNCILDHGFEVDYGKT